MNRSWCLTLYGNGPMKKRPALIAVAAAVLGLGVGFYLHGVAE